ncbi:MAG: recombinase family protein [candidate division Zixibacteria bacterium]
MCTKVTSQTVPRGLSPGESPPLIIAGYIRVSTENQVDGYGLESQESAIQKFARKNKLGAIRIYTERGVSGDLEDRPALGQLMVDVKEGRVGKVIVVRLDRLARDLMLQENILADLKQHNAELISIDEPDLCSSDPTRVLFRQIKGAISEYEKKMIKVRLKAGRMSKASDGGFVGGRRPLGYKRVDKYNGKKRPDLIIDPESIETVRLIFSLKRKHWSQSKIARHLKDNGFKTARGGNWYQSTVRAILTNPIYKGKMNYNGLGFKRLDLAIS